MVGMGWDVTNLHLSIFQALSCNHACNTILLNLAGWIMLACLPCLAGSCVSLFLSISTAHIQYTPCESWKNWFSPTYNLVQLPHFIMHHILTCTVFCSLWFFYFSLWLYKASVGVCFFFFLPGEELKHARKLLCFHTCHKNNISSGLIQMLLF